MSWWRITEEKWAMMMWGLFVKLMLGVQMNYFSMRGRVYYFLGFDSLLRKKLLVEKTSYQKIFCNRKRNVFTACIAGFSVISVQGTNDCILIRTLTWRVKKMDSGFFLIDSDEHERIVYKFRMHISGVRLQGYNSEAHGSWQRTFLEVLVS